MKFTVPTEDSKYVMDRMSFFDLFKSSEYNLAKYRKICKEFQKEHDAKTEVVN